MSRWLRREKLVAIVLSTLMIMSVFVPQQWSFGEVTSGTEQVQEIKPENQQVQGVAVENQQVQEVAVENQQAQDTKPEDQQVEEIKPEIQIEYYKSGEGMVSLPEDLTITLEEEGRTELNVNIIKPEKSDPNYDALLEKYDALRKTVLIFKVGDQDLGNYPIENNATLYADRHWGAGEMYDYTRNRRVAIQAKQAGEETITIEIPDYEPVSVKFVVTPKPPKPPTPEEPEAKDQYFNFYLLNANGEREKLQSPDKGWTIYKPYREEYAVQAELKDSARESLKKDLKDELVSRLKSKVKREVGVGEGPEYEAKLAEGIQKIDENLDATLQEELDQAWWWWEIDSSGVKERQSPIKRLGSGYDGSSDETNIFKFRIVETQEDSDSISIQINNYGNMEPKFDPYRSSVAAIRIRLPKTEAPLADVQLQHRVEGEEWKVVDGDLNLNYDFGEGNHLLKAASTAGKVEWEVPEDVKQALKVYDYGDGTLRFGAIKVGDFTATTKVGNQKKDIVIHIAEAAEPRLMYRVETENLWRYISKDGLHLIKDKPVIVRIDNGVDGWKCEANNNEQETVILSADAESNVWKIEPKKAGNTTLRFTLNDKNVDVNIEVEEENHLPKVYFQSKDGEKKYLDPQNRMVLTVLDEGEFHIEGKGLKVLRWDAKEKYYLTNTKYAFHFWIDQFSRYNPRKSGVQNATVVYEENGKVLKHTFVIQVLPSEIEEIKAYVGERELTKDEPIQVQGSERVHIIVKGKIKGQEEFKLLPETAYRLKDQEDQHIMGSSFALWKPGTFNVNVFMRDNPEVQANFSAQSVYVPVTGLVGEVPAVWEMDEWNSLSGNFNGIRWYDSLDKGYTLSVSPRNASVIDLKWESLTPEIAYYDPLYSNGIVPKKPGIAKFLVSSVDKPEIKKEVQVEFRYKYPLTSVVAIANHSISTGKVKNLNLGINPENASEQRFHWSYSKPGIVHISDMIYTDPSNVNTPKKTVHTMRGIKAGTVTVTGTPYDQTSGARSIEFEVVVKNSVNENDISDLNDVLSWAQNKMNRISDVYASRSKLSDYWKIAENGKLKKEISKNDVGYIYNNVFTEGKITKDTMTLAKSILALRATGIDPERYYGYNLVSELGTKEIPKDTIYQLSTYLWALSSDNYGVPYIKENREEAVMAILAMQNLETGLWLDGENLWQDATGFALYALAPYYNNSEEVKHAVELSVAAIGLKQQADGDISDNSNSLAMVAGGLWSCNPEYLTDKRLVSNGKTLLHALKKYEGKNPEEFVWKQNSEGGKELATEQAFRSLISYFEGNVFDYRDIPKKGIDTKAEDQGNNAGSDGNSQPPTQTPDPKQPSTPAPGSSGGGSTGGGGSSGGSGGSGGSTAQPKTTETNKSDVKNNNDTATKSQLDETISAEVNVDKATGTAKAELTAENIQKSVDKLVEKTKEASNKGSELNLNIDVQGDKDSKTIEAVIPKDAVKNMADKVDAVQINTSLGTVSLDRVALSDLSNKAQKQVSVVLEKKMAADTPLANAGEADKKKVEGRPIVELKVVTDGKKADVKGRFTVSLKYEQKIGEQAEAVVVYKVMSDGTMEIVKTSEFKTETSEVSMNLKNAEGTYVIGYNKVEFNDVDKHWASKTIAFLAAREVLNGKGEGRFEPQGKVSRAEFAQILANLSGIDLSKYRGSKFADVSAGSWYAGAVAWATEAGIAGGTGNGKFSPDASISRQDMAVMIDKYLKSRSESIKTENQAVNFADGEKVAGYAKSAVETMQKAGIINGAPTGNGSFRFNPTANVTRAETATMIVNYIKQSQAK